MILQPYNRKKVGDIEPLSEMLPLKVPFSILIDPTNKCNFRCTFCPTGNPSLLDEVRRPIGYMEYGLYTKIINDISSLCTKQNVMLNHLHLYKDGEPLMNKKLGSMIAYAKKMEVSHSVEITTNAAALTKKRAVELIECGLDVVRVSIEHVTDEKYKQITKTFGNYNRIRRNVRFLFEEKAQSNSELHLHLKIVDTGLSDIERNKFISDFSEISDSINIDKPMGWSRSFEDLVELDLKNKVGMDGVTEKRDRVVCPEPFSKLAINFDGTVSICCVDWSHGTIVGDLKKQSLIDIWSGDEMKQFRLLHLQGRRSEILACSNCDYMQGFSDITNLDNDMDRLLLAYQ